MAVQVAAEEAARTLRIAYQPFLSSTRTKQMTSILSKQLPYTFLPCPDTSMSIPPNVHIVLLSRNGKPFAPASQRPSVDSTVHREIRESDWNRSAEQYQSYLDRWEQIQTRLPSLLATLKQHFSDRVIAQEAFHVPLKILAYAGDVKDVDAMQATIKEYRFLRRSQKFLQPILKQSQAATKAEAHRSFSVQNLELRESQIELHRDRLDCFKLELEKRYMGMGLVRFPEDAESKPWILLPEDPLAVWGQDFAHRIGELIRLAQIRFMLTEEEKEIVLEAEARTILEDNLNTISNDLLASENVSGEDLFRQIVDELRQRKVVLYHDDDIPLSLSGMLGDLGPGFRAPITKEDKAVYQINDEKLVEKMAWRVED